MSAPADAAPSTALPADLQALREALETVDRDLLALLKRRMELAEEVAEAKLTGAFPFRDALREEHVLQRVRHAAAELGLDAHEVERLYRLVMEMSVARQQAHVHSLESAPLRVTYQGVEGSYSQLAAQRHYGGRPGGVLLTGCESFRAAAEQVRSGAADLALLPIENTTAGSINETYDLLAEWGPSGEGWNQGPSGEGEHGLVITAEVVSHIEHCLLAMPGATVEQLRTVMSHPQALAQCQAFFAAHPWLAARAEFDTAGAARKVRESGDATLGAIASESAGRAFGLAVLAAGIQTQQGNFTRFVEVAPAPAPVAPDAACKTSLLVTVANQPGALGEVLLELSKRGVNLTKLESRPIPGSPWRYRFYVDVEGHVAAERVSAALAAIRERAEVRVLGTYPRSPLAGA